MRRILVVSTPAILEARNLAAWITRERIPGVRIAPSRGEWGVFAPASHAERARRAFRKVVAANNPGGHRVVFKIRPTDPYTSMKKRYTFGRGIQIADMLVKGIVLKAAVLDGKGKVRFVAFKKTGRVASNPGMDALADAAVMMAARGARQYLDTHKLTADPAALTACLKSWVKIKFPEALKDAKDAISAGMHQMAEATFAATMKLAGIEAAKEAARPPGASRNRARRNQPTKPRYYQDSTGKIHDWRSGAIATLPVSPVIVMSYRTKPPGLFRTWRGGGERHWDYLGPSAERSPLANPRGFVPMEVKGTTQAARLLKFLRKYGVRAKLRRSKPGWFGFTCPISQEDKSYQLCMKWSTISEGMDRPTDKALAAEKRWRLRQRRRRHRRGYRRDAYYIGGKPIPRDRPLPNVRRSRRNGPYYYTPKYRPPMTGTVPSGFTLVEAPRIGRWRQDLPVSSYTYGVISYPTALSDKDMERYELDYATPRAGSNPRRSRRNAHSKTQRVRRNVSIESKWPTMTDRQRREALRIIGIQEDIAELWSGKSWGALSSVVKTLLARSWKHGGDTTKIRRVPVGAR